MEVIERNRVQIKEFDDLRGVDLSAEDLSGVSTDILLKCDFDTKTVWPELEKLPIGFDPQKVIEGAKNPGLGIRELHEQGIDGQGITVAIIDQALSSTRGKFDAHEEYSQNIIDYKEINLPDNEGISNHGPAVASLLVGRTCGVAPGAKLVYRAVPHTPDSVEVRDFNFYADALLDLIEYNKTLPANDKIRIVSCSIGCWEEKPEPGLDRWFEIIQKAEAEGIIVSDVGERMGIDYVGGGTTVDKNNIDNYSRALFLKDDDVLNELILKEDIEGILKRLREIHKDETADISDDDLRKIIKTKLEKAWKERENEIIVPSDYRAMSSRKGPKEFVYNGEGGISWAVPYLSGIFALVWQIRPDLTKEQIAEIVNQTATLNNKKRKVINPKGIIDVVQSLRQGATLP